jgi:hypothetical protein
MGERHLSIISTNTGPACQRPNVATESSKFSPTSLSEMKTYDTKNSYYPQPTRVDHGREEFINSFKIYRSWQILILYNQSIQMFGRSINLNIEIVHIFHVINMQEIH